MFELEDGFDCIEWVRQQAWSGDFIGSCGGSYVGQTQWPMSLHPSMSAIIPEVSGLGVAANTVHLHMNIGAYARTVGRGQGKVQSHHSDHERAIVAETLASGVFNAPLHPNFSPEILSMFPELGALSGPIAREWLWRTYCSLPSAGRRAVIQAAYGVDDVTIVEIESSSDLFGHSIAHDAHSIPSFDKVDLARRLHAPALIHTGWYDWALNDALATFHLVRSSATDRVASATRLIIAPSSHNKMGYTEGVEARPELQHNHRAPNHIELMLQWYDAVGSEDTDRWPPVVYYLMGANEWRSAPSWPPPNVKQLDFYLEQGGRLRTGPAVGGGSPTQYTYDPDEPTPSVGGKVVSGVYPAGSVDLQKVHGRHDVAVFTSEVLVGDLDVVGPMSVALFASATARDTDFAARISDVFPDGRALFVQSGILRARYRGAEPELLEPGKIVRFEIDLWSTAHRFKSGHRLRLDISSADFPQFDRNSNLGGEPGAPISSTQSIYHDDKRRSKVTVSILPTTPELGAPS